MVLIERNSHPKRQIRNLHQMIIIIVLLTLDGQAPTYSTMQIRTSKLLANVNTVNENDDNNKVIVSNDVLTTRGNYSSMFDNNFSTFTNSQARISTYNYTSSSSTSSSSTSSSSAPTYDQLTAHI